MRAVGGAAEEAIGKSSGCRKYDFAFVGPAALM